MSDKISQDTIGNLFMNILQHMKCIETRLEYAKCATSQRQKHALNMAISKVQSAVNGLCDLLGDSEQIAKVKQQLDKADLVYLMIFTEELFRLPEQDLEEVAVIIEEFVNKKYAGNDQ